MQKHILNNTKDINIEELPSFRLKQFNKQYYQEAIESWEELSTWPKNLRETLKKELPFSSLVNIQTYTSQDGRTVKALSETLLGNPVESVMMKTKERITICISCMCGCPVGCEFCATGKLGLNKILSSEEIVDQILFFQRLLKKTDERITNVVYMGMGEPMLNLENVLESINVLTDPEKFGLSHRRITVSTVGYIKQLEEFFKADTKTKLAISLHAPNQELREELMPTAAKSNDLKELMNVLKKQEEKTNKRITYEYILLKGINDSPEHAQELSKLLKGRLALVNLINFNPSPTLEFESADRDTIAKFQNILFRNGVNNTLRYSMGSEVKGACGQLAAQ